MKILLVQPQANYGRRLPETPSRALLILGTVAQQRGHEVKILHADLLNGHIPDEFATFKPDVVGITCNTLQVKSAREIAKQAKEIGARVILGGPHACVWDTKTDPVDKVVIGEGENAFLEFIGEKPNIKTIDDIPTPNYDLVDLHQFCGISPVGALPSMAIMASRGCPFECTFCNTPVFWGKKVRYRNPQSVVDEIELLHKQYGAGEIFFQDDTFNLNHTWAPAIFEELIKRELNTKMLFKICCRVNEKMLTEKFLDLAYRAGVWNIFYGIESGSQTMLERMKKGITVSEIKRAMKITREAKIQSQCSFVVGLPGENLQTLQATAELIREINPTKYGWTFFCPFPKTEATQEVINKGYIKSGNYEEYGYGKVWCRTDDLDFSELEAFRGF